ncbi:MAG: transcriptional regulator [Alphaproteobacteria bacterium PA3]|nr:MAG: transcriptional regulator [Alphaproteobacteria bacterium PA3]
MIIVSENSSQREVFQVSGAQIRAARALLGISSQALSELSDVGWATIRRFEEGSGIPPNRGGTLARVASALERAGIEFFGDPIQSPGVRLHRDRVQRDN